MIKSAKDRKTSADMLHFTRLVNASMNAGKISLEKDSAFKASRKRLTIPMSQLVYSRY